MRVSIRPGRARGEVYAPPSKSYAHRSMLCAALAEGSSIINGIIRSGDMLATMDCINKIGAVYEAENTSLIIRGRVLKVSEDVLFDCRDSGSTYRFFIPAALLTGEKVRFTGSERLLKRGVGVYEELFRHKGITVEKQKGIMAFEGQLRPGEYVIPGDISSQFVSGLLFALPLLDGDSFLKVLPPVESRAYIDITADVLARFGIEIEERKPGLFYIMGGQHYHPADITVEGDWSSAAALYAFNSFQGEVRVSGLDDNSIQPDRNCLEYFKRLEKENCEIDISSCPDLGPVLFAVAAAEKGAVFKGIRRLRNKESDRVQAMAEELKKFGANVLTEEDRAVVFPAEIRTPQEILFGHDDHRIVMAMSLLASITGGVIDGAEAVRKSFPDYFEVLSELGLKIDRI